jgi:hypothetical protein
MFIATASDALITLGYLVHAQLAPISARISFSYFLRLLPCRTPQIQSLTLRASSPIGRRALREAQPMAVQLSAFIPNSHPGTMFIQIQVYFFCFQPTVARIWSGDSPCREGKTFFISSVMRFLQPATVTHDGLCEGRRGASTALMLILVPAAFVRHLERSDDPPMAKFCTVPSFPFETRHYACFVHVSVAIFALLLVSSFTSISFGVSA